MEKYQGFAIVFDQDGSSIEIYKSEKKQDYERDIKQGQLTDGSIIVENEWLEKSITKEDLLTIAGKLYESMFEHAPEY